MTSVLGVHWKDWCWSWNSNTLATWCEELTHLKRPWCWERLKAGGEGDDRGWDGWMASPTQWTWVWLNSRSWWWTGRPGVVQFIGSLRVRHNWATELNWWNSFIFNIQWEILWNECITLTPSANLFKIYKFKMWIIFFTRCYKWEKERFLLKLQRDISKLSLASVLLF